LGDAKVPEFYMPKFRNALSIPSSYVVCRHRPM